MDCLICGSTNTRKNSDIETMIDTYECNKCGAYAITDQVKHVLMNEISKKNKLKSLLRERKINNYEGIAIFKEKPDEKVRYGQLLVEFISLNKLSEIKFD